MKLLRVAAAVLSVVLGAATAHGAPLVGASFTDGLLYDVDAATGAVSAARQIRVSSCTQFCGGIADDVGYVAGIEVAGDALVVITTLTEPMVPSRLLWTRVDDPFVLLPGVGWLGGEVQIGEGDLARDPASGELYAVGLTDSIAPFTLVRIPAFGNAIVTGQIGFSDVSGLAFDAAGTLYALDTGSDALLVLDPTDASTLSTTPLSEPLGATAGMDFDPDTDTLYVADGGTGGRDALFTLDPATGELTEIGPLGLENGLSGLAVVPEPAHHAAGVAAIASLALLQRRPT